MKKYNWILEFKDNGNGHSLWFDTNSQKHSIKDRSGKRPHLTDDGVLWIDSERNAEIFYSNNSGLLVSIPLYNKNGSPSSTLCECEFGIKIAKMFNIKIKIEDKVKKLVQQLKEIDDLVSV